MLKRQIEQGYFVQYRLHQLQEIPNLPIVTVNHPLLEVGMHCVRTDHALEGHALREDLTDPKGGEVLIKSGERITSKMLKMAACIQYSTEGHGNYTNMAQK